MRNYTYLDGARFTINNLFRSLRFDIDRLDMSWVDGEKPEFCRGLRIVDNDEVNTITGDFSLMNQRFNTSKSSTSHERLAKDPEEFYLYHSLYREARQTWSEIPFEVMAEQINKRPDWVVGDFGCGEALLSKSVRNKVYSFDHVAINPSVIACDMSNTGLDGEILDVAVFSLSLMGTNWQDYLKEAFRMLRPGGLLKISEPASSWEKDNFSELKQGIEAAGLQLLGDVKLSSKFVYLDAAKPL